jgi:2-dehydro-3-deoxygluconokinase
MRERGRSVSFDPNLRPSLWPSGAVMRETLNALAARCDWVLPGLAEGRLLTGRETAADIAAFYRERGARAVVLKLGPEGAWYDGEVGGRQSSGHVPAFPVKQVVDTVGAGDGFAAGVISALVEGLSLREAATRGAWIGARAVQVRGDTEGLPTRAELQAALK